MSNSQEQTDLPGPGLGVTFLYYFSMTTLIVVVVGAPSWNWNLASAQLYQYGVAFGLFAGVVGTYFNRTISFDVTFKNSNRFVTNLNQVLADMGFEQKDSSSERLDDSETKKSKDSTQRYLTYQRSTLASLLGGKVYVILRPTAKAATIASRAAIIRRLRQKL